MDVLKATQSFSALSQSARLEAYRLLVQAGEDGLPAGDISDRLGVRQNTMSANLSVLLQAGLVRTVREGRSIRYFANYEAMRGLLGFLMEECCGGRPELCQPIIDEIACAC